MTSQPPLTRVRVSGGHRCEATEGSALGVQQHRPSRQARQVPSVSEAEWFLKDSSLLRAPKAFPTDTPQNDKIGCVF